MDKLGFGYKDVKKLIQKLFIVQLLDLELTGHTQKGWV